MTERRGDPTEPQSEVDGSGYAIVLVMVGVIFLLIGVLIGLAIGGVF